LPRRSEARTVESGDAAGAQSQRWKPFAKLRVVAQVRYMSQSPVPMWKKPSARSPSVPSGWRLSVGPAAPAVPPAAAAAAPPGGAGGGGSRLAAKKAA
jgi:hypothetical protein